MGTTQTVKVKQTHETGLASHAHTWTVYLWDLGSGLSQSQGQGDTSQLRDSPDNWVEFP